MDGFKRDRVVFVARCSNSQHVKANYQRSGGLNQVTDFHTWKCEEINMDVVVGFLKPKEKMNHFGLLFIY